MKHETSLTLHAYWQGRRDEIGVAASAIRAAELAPILPSLFLVDLDLTAGFRFRFCGAAIAARFGRDLAEEGFLPLWRTADREALARDMRVMSGSTMGLVAGAMAETLGGGFTAFELAILPLTGERGAAGAIGSMARIGGHEEHNRIRARIVALTLRSTRFLPYRGNQAVSTRPPLGLAPPVVTAGVRHRRRHLTILSGGLSP